MTTDNHIRTEIYHRSLKQIAELGCHRGELVIKLEHVKKKHRRHHTNCTKRSHLTYAAYKRVFHHRGTIRRVNPNSCGGTVNFWPLSPCRKGDNGYPMPDGQFEAIIARHAPPKLSLDAP